MSARLPQLLSDRAVLRRLRDAYAATEYEVAGTPPRVLRIGEASTLHAIWLQAGGHRSATLLTACNPFSEILPGIDNARRHQALEQVIDGAGLARLPTTTRDPGAQWPPEPGCCVFDLPPALLDHWLERFEQAAAVSLSLIAPCRLVWHPALRAAAAALDH